MKEEKMKRASTVKFVKRYFRGGLKDFCKNKKVIEILNKRNTQYGYTKAEVIWEDEK